MYAQIVGSLRFGTGPSTRGNRLPQDVVDSPNVNIFNLVSLPWADLSLLLADICYVMLCYVMLCQGFRIFDRGQIALQQSTLECKILATFPHPNMFFLVL